MRRSLRRRGFAQVCSWNYSPLLTDIARGAADLGAHIERICEQTGHERVHVVGHSLGGLIARYHVQRQGGDRRVESLVTLGTPHQGSLLAHVLPTPLIRQLRPGSPLLRELAEPAPDCRTRVTAVYSDLDQIVMPTSVRPLRAPRPEGPQRAGPRRRPHVAAACTGGVVDEVAATLAGCAAPAGTRPPSPVPTAAVRSDPVPRDPPTAPRSRHACTHRDTCCAVLGRVLTIVTVRSRRRYSPASRPLAPPTDRLAAPDREALDREGAPCPASVHPGPRAARPARADGARTTEVAPAVATAPETADRPEAADAPRRSGDRRPGRPAPRRPPTPPPARPSRPAVVRRPRRRCRCSPALPSVLGAPAP